VRKAFDAWKLMEQGIEEMVEEEEESSSVDEKV